MLFEFVFFDENSTQTFTLINPIFTAIKKKNIDPISSNAAVNDCCLDCLVNYSRLILLALRNEDENLFPLTTFFTHCYIDIENLDE